jgi:Double-GTPase 2
VDVFDSVRAFLIAIYAVLAVVAFALAGVALCAAQTLAVYLITGAAVLYRPPGGLPARRRPFTPPADADPARISYFYGPARSDLRYIRQVGWSRWQAAAGAWRQRVSEVFDDASEHRAFIAPPAAGLAAGLVIGLPAAAAVVAAVALAHEVLMAVATAGVRCTAGTLRAVDSVYLRVRHIKVRCVACFERIPYPAYLCPNPECRETHWNIRPGRHGVLRRTCRCGQRMPTLLLFGSARKLDAICSRRACKQPLEHRPGQEREIIFPLFGSRGAGKTRLVYGIVKTLEESSRPGVQISYADSGTTTRMRDLESGLAEGYGVPATPSAELPKAYQLRLRIGRHRRIVRLIDAAGELFYDSQSSASLVYLGDASTFVLVIDPLSIGDFWDHLPSAARERLAPYRSIAPHPLPVYQQTADRITEMGRQRGPRRLAVVFSRADLIGPDFGPGASTGDEVRKWAEDDLGLAGLIRGAESDFRDVGLFHTAPFSAVPVSAALDGRGSSALTDLVHWLMRAEGITAPEQAGGQSPAPS